jgi:hypothetical protein
MNLQNRDKVIPKWMQQHIDKNNIPGSIMRPVEYYSTDVYLLTLEC